MLTAKATLAIGRSPSDIAVSVSGDRIYVPNTADNTVSVISAASGGTFALAETIPNVTAPVSVDVTPDGLLLLVACSTSAQVLGIATRNPGSARTVFSMKSNPVHVRLRPGTSYALVTNSEKNLTLLRIDTGMVVDNVLSIGNSAGLAVSADGSLAISLTSGAYTEGLWALTFPPY
jgi:DNA-binding beta-propeller fold protein YncE